MSMRKQSVLLLAALIAATGCGAATPVIRIDANEVIGKAKPMIYGHNIEAADERGIFQGINLPKPSPDSVNTGKGHWDPVAGKSDPTGLKVLKELNTGMLRYPGGCLAHNYDWRMTVGPVESRPDWKFGLDEFLVLCRETGAEPIITFSDYVLPADELPRLAAEMVEYLNAPATAKYPQAMKRAANGHREPYKVKYFEIGNETYHTNHNLTPARSFTPESYADFARKTIAAVKKVDPSVQLGVVAHGMNLSEQPDYWDSVIYRELVPLVDFVVHHYYAPALRKASVEAALLGTASAGDVLTLKIANTRRQIRELGGRSLPIQITEYNVSGAENEPPRWQDSFLAGLNAADMLREFRVPGNDIDSACYWQAIGGFFGFCQRDGKGGHLYKAPWPFFRLWAQKTGDTLLKAEIIGNPRMEIIPAGFGQTTAKGEKFIPARSLGAVTSVDYYFNDLHKAKATGSGNAKHLTFRFDGEAEATYPNILTIRRPAQLPESGGFSIDASFEARWVPAPGNTGEVALGFGLMDSRGYAATGRAVAVYGLDLAKEWKQYATSLSVGADCKTVTGLLRYEKPKGALKGVLEIRNLEFKVNGDAVIPAAHLLAVEASRLANGNLALAVINRSPGETLTARIETGRKITSGIARELYQEDVNFQRAFEPAEKPVAESANGSFEWKFPPHSLTIFELK